MLINSQTVYGAYRKLKQMVYYDKTDLNLRRRLAEFECSPEFNDRLNVVHSVVTAEKPATDPRFKGWLEKVSFRVVPKGVEIGQPECNERNFISNVTSAKILRVPKVNYFFDGPIELQLLAVIWIMCGGYTLDESLGAECYGSRLESKSKVQNENSPALYRKYHEWYAKWRDTGVRKAKQIVTEDKESVSILALDIKEFYYWTQLDVQAIVSAIQESLAADNPNATSLVSTRLIECIDQIGTVYHTKIQQHLSLTHGEIPANRIGLPIGLCCSPLIANWCLREFDQLVKSRLRPAYYGRYVDDIMLVILTPELPVEDTDKVASFIDRVLVANNVLRRNGDDQYETTKPSGLYLQREKCFLHHFDVKHSVAGLAKFQKTLEENASDFLLLPVDETESSLEDVAYELLYEGSVNKFRSTRGTIENRYELAKYLTRQTMLHLITDDPPDRATNSALRRFFRGRNAIEFADLWERVLTFYFVSRDRNAFDGFAKQLRLEIRRVRFQGMDGPVTDLLILCLETHLSLCCEMVLGLDVIVDKSGPGEMPTPRTQFRLANLIRHHFVPLALLNYTKYPGNLCARQIKESFEFDDAKVVMSPRFVNFDECMLLATSEYLALMGKSPVEFAKEKFEQLNLNVELQGFKLLQNAGESKNE